MQSKFLKSFKKKLCLMLAMIMLFAFFGVTVQAATAIAEVPSIYTEHWVQNKFGGSWYLESSKMTYKKHNLQSS